MKDVIGTFHLLQDPGIMLGPRSYDVPRAVEYGRFPRKDAARVRDF